MNRLSASISLGLLMLLTACYSFEDPSPNTPVVNTTNPGSFTTVPGMTPTAIPNATAFDTTGQKLLGQGTFMNNVHTVSGRVKIYEKSGSRTLVFTDFKSDGGPDLRIYVAENTGLRNAAEITRLSESGNFSVQLPVEVDPAKQRFVLIWCKAFSVLFGSAEVK